MSNYNKMSDMEIIRKVKNGDKEVFGIIVERYMRKAYSIALYWTGDSHLAWDVSQEAFFKIFKGIKKFDENRPFLPYLYRVVLNIVKRIKIKKREEGIEGLIVPVEDDPQKTMETEELRERIRSAIDKLDEKDREIIYLRHFAGLSYEEIADALGIPMGTVMSRLYYARKRLAKWMKEYMNS